MPRPKDLPKPVRHHGAHENLHEVWKAREAPGPGTYTLRNPTDSKLTSFSKGQRFREGQLGPGDMRTSVTKENANDVPGPIYNPRSQSRQATAAMTYADRFRGGVQAVPGPGSYTISSDWKTGVSFTKGVRNPNRGLSDGNTATPTTYSPKIVARRVKGGGWNKASGTFFDDNGRSRYADAPTMASLDAIDRAKNFVKVPTATISFSKANRFGDNPQQRADSLGPGAYNVVQADRSRWGPGHSAKFGSSRRMQRHVSGSAGFIALPRPDVTSNHRSSPSAGFSKFKANRGIPNPADTSTPAAIYNPQRADSQGRISVGFTTAPKFPPSRDATPGPGPAASGINLPSSVGQGPKAPFSKAAKTGTSFKELVSNEPGPGAYNVGPRRRPDSASGRSMGKSERTIDMAAQSSGAGSREEVPGPKYNPDYEVTRPRSAQPISIHRMNRPMGPRETAGLGGQGGSAGDYTPMYSHIDRNKRGAVLYLTG